MRSFGYLFLVVGTVLLLSAKCGNPQGECDEIVTVVDMSALDGCGIMFETTSGNKLLPANLQQFNLKLDEGEQVSISYTVMEGAASICMSENAIVELSCLILLGEKDTDCKPIVDPFEIPWSRDVMKTLDPIRVEEQVINGKRIYHYLGRTEGRYYACQGELLCSYSNGQKQLCAQFSDANNPPRVIYVLDETP